MNNGHENNIISDITCRFASKSDLKINDDRVSFNLPNTDLYINFIVHDGDLNTTKILTNIGLKLTGLSEMELFEKAIKNTYLKEGVMVKSFRELLGFQLIDEIPSLVVTNSQAHYGAISILHKDTCRRVREELGDFYILPSSVHEVICVSKNIIDCCSLLKTVTDINKSEFMIGAVLADDIFEITRNGIQSVFNRG